MAILNDHVEATSVLAEAASNPQLLRAMHAAGGRRKELAFVLFRELQQRGGRQTRQAAQLLGRMRQILYDDVPLCMRRDLPLASAMALCVPKPPACPPPAHVLQALAAASSSRGGDATTLRKRTREEEPEGQPAAKRCPAPEAVRPSSQARACPNGHTLPPRLAPTLGFCDQCQSTFQAWDVIMWCEACNWVRCKECQASALGKPAELRLEA